MKGSAAAATATASSSSLRHERTSSIESEPLTLSLQQMQYAREAALCVLNTNSFDAAVNIFTEGLQAVQVCVAAKDMDGDELNYLKEEEYQGLERMRDIVTAPF